MDFSKKINFGFKKKTDFFPQVEIVKVLLLIEANNLCHHSLNLKKLIQLELMQAVYKRHHKVRTSNWTSSVIEWLKGCIEQQMLLRLCGGRQSVCPIDQLFANDMLFVD